MSGYARIKLGESLEPLAAALILLSQKAADYCDQNQLLG